MAWIDQLRQEDRLNMRQNVLSNLINSYFFNQSEATKSILTLSVAAIGYNLTVIGDPGFTHIFDFWVITLAGFSVSIVGCLLSYVFTASIQDISISVLKIESLKFQDEDSEEYSDEDYDKMIEVLDIKRNRNIILLNGIKYLTYGCFMLGIGSIISQTFQLLP